MISYIPVLTLLLAIMLLDLKIRKIPNSLFMIFLFCSIIYGIVLSNITIYLVLSLIAILIFYLFEYLSVPEIKILFILSFFVESPISLVFFYKILAFACISIYALYTFKKRSVRRKLKYFIEPIIKLKVNFVIDLVLFSCIFFILLSYFKLPFTITVLISIVFPMIFSKIKETKKALISIVIFFSTVVFIGIDPFAFISGGIIGLGMFVLVCVLPRFFKAIIYDLIDNVSIKKLQEGIYLSRSYSILKNGRLAIKKDLFKNVVDGFDEKNFLFSSIGNTAKHFVDKKKADVIERELDKREIKKLRGLAKKKKLNAVEVYLPANKLLNYLSMFIALLIEVYGLVII